MIDLDRALWMLAGAVAAVLVRLGTWLLLVWLRRRSNRVNVIKSSSVDRYFERGDRD